MQAQGMWSTGQDDGKERFLADLRALRDTAALEFDELAARAHYPSDVLKEAESGPSLPGLPILAAYVRACDGDVPEWEERWRRLGFESRVRPSLPVRPPGASPAAVAGARAGVSVAPPDAYDPERIKAALRGSHGGSGRGAHDTASGAARGPDSHIPAAAEARIPDSPTSWSAGTSWDGSQRDGFQSDAGARWDGVAADVDGTPGNGNHHLSQAGDGSSDTADSWFAPRAKAGGERTWPTADAEPPPGATSTWFTPSERADGTLPPSEPTENDTAPPPEHTGSAAARVTGLWTPSAAASAPGTEFQRPGPSPVDGPAAPRAARPTSADTPASDPPGTAERTTPVLAGASATAPSRTMTAPAVPPGPVVPPGEPRPDRLYLARLLVVILVAALIGSLLVLLLR